MSQMEMVQGYVARQPRLAWRRWLLRGLIRSVGFGLVWQMDIRGRENIPDSGPVILIINHISFIDPVLCMGAVINRYVIPMSKAENMRNPATAPFLWWWGAYVINRGEIDRRALTSSIELLRSGQMILVAPEGTRQTDGLTRPKDGMTYIATRANAVIVPAALADAEDWLDRLKSLRRTHIKLHFGRPFRFKTGGRERIPREEMALMTDEAMYQLALALDNEKDRGVYRDLSKATTNYLEFVEPR
jgi:1-acyl-sn-glycerol-3-phosphate acyltransferase